MSTKQLYPYTDRHLVNARYQCAYCKQRCHSLAVLMSHESQCPTRRAKQKEWAEERNRYAFMQRMGWVKDHGKGSE